MEMKKTVALLSAIAAASFLASAQEITYSLPFTSFTVEVEAQRTTFYAGPYAKYAEEMLNINVTDKNKTVIEVEKVTVIPKLEADPWAPLLSAPASSKELCELTSQGLVVTAGALSPDGMAWRFPAASAPDFGKGMISGPSKAGKRIVYKTIVTEEGELKYPSEQSVLLAKSEEDKAQAAADLILKVRKERHDIAVGNTDASFSGEALGTALQELEKIENENLLLFTGYSVREEVKAEFEVLPSASSREQIYTAFCLTDDGRLVSEGEGEIYQLSLTPVSIPEEPEVDEAAQAKAKKKGAVVKYRIPAVCSLELIKDGEVYNKVRVPVYQLGREAELIIQK